MPDNIPSLDDVFRDFFANPSPGACYRCGTTKNLHVEHRTTKLIGDADWMICDACAEQKARELSEKKEQIRKRYEIFNRMDLSEQQALLDAVQYLLEYNRQ